MMKEHNTFESWKNISPLVNSTIQVLYSSTSNDNSDKDVNQEQVAHFFYLLQ